MMWVWQGCGVKQLIGWMSLLEVGWCGAAAWWWRLEADAELVLLPGGGSWKLMLILSNVQMFRVEISKCQNVHNVISPLFVSFCAILYSLAVFPLFLHWNLSLNPEDFCIFYTILSTLWFLLNFCWFFAEFCWSRLRRLCKIRGKQFLHYSTSSATTSPKRHVSHYLAPNKKANMAYCSTCEVLQVQIIGFNVISWIIYDKLDQNKG